MYKKKLTAKQRKFADNYIMNGCNGYQAAISSGYKMSKNTRKTAHELLKNPLIKAYIRYKIEHHTSMSRAELLNILDAIVKGNIEENPKITFNRIKAVTLLLKLYNVSDTTDNDPPVIIIENDNLVEIKTA
jgi:phage terminase small subunit